MNGDLGPEARHAEQLVLLDGHDQRLKIQKPHMKAPRPLNLRAVCFRNSNAVGDRPTGVSHPHPLTKISNITGLNTYFTAPSNPFRHDAERAAWRGHSYTLCSLWPEAVKVWH